MLCLSIDTVGRGRLLKDGKALVNLEALEILAEAADLTTTVKTKCSFSGTMPIVMATSFKLRPIVYAFSRSSLCPS